MTLHKVPTQPVEVKSPPSRPAGGPSRDRKPWWPASELGADGPTPDQSILVWDFFGAPAWIFWLACIAIGAIAGMLYAA